MAPAKTARSKRSASPVRSISPNKGAPSKSKKQRTVSIDDDASTVQASSSTGQNKQASLSAFFRGHNVSPSKSPSRPQSLAPSKSQEELDIEAAIAASMIDHKIWLAANEDPTLPADQVETRSCPTVSSADEPAQLDRLASGSRDPQETIGGPASSKALRSANLSAQSNEPRSFLQKSLTATRHAMEAAASKLKAKTAPAPRPQKPDAFSVLMKSHSEQKEWAKADEVVAANYQGRARSRIEARTAPFYKVLQGMPLSVDAFCYGRIDGCQAYFLTHWHSDHYTNLSANWSHGPIYCSKTTANLMRLRVGVAEKYIKPLDMEVPTLIPNSGGVTVTCIEANHCPGSCLFLFEGPQTADILPSAYKSTAINSGRTFRYLHCGDFRASPVHVNHPLLKGKKLDIIYLDTTYLNPRYCFPAQEQVIEACAALVRSRLPDSQRLSAEAREQEGGAGPSGQDLQFLPKAIGTTVLSPEDQKAALAMKAWLTGSKADGSNPPAEPLQSQLPEGEESEEALPLAPDADEEQAWAECNDVGGELFGPEDDPALERERSCSVLPEATTPGPGEALVTIKSELLDKAESVPADDQEPRRAVEPADLSEAGAEDTKSERVTDPASDSKSGIQWLQQPGKQAEAKRKSGRLLVVIGTYTIGKERIVKAVARIMNSQIYCADKRKYQVYAQLEDSELHAMLTRDPGASVHVTNLQAINGEGLRDTVAALRARGYDFTHAIAFRPTGWTYKPPAGMDTTAPSLERLIAWNQSRTFTPANLYPTRDSTPEYSIYGVPYSEHSSFFELTAFALSLKYDRIIATVNVGSPASRNKQAGWFEKWLQEKRRRQNAGLPPIVTPRHERYW